MGGRAGNRHRGSEGALEMLERCHQKVSERIELLIWAAASWAESRDPQALEDAKFVSGFLARAGRRHELDEEESVFPRLPMTAELTSTLRVLRAEHRDHEREGRALAQLVAIKSGPAPEELRRCANRLASAYRAHITLEDAKLMPAVRALSADQLAEIYVEMQARRGR